MELGSRTQQTGRRKGDVISIFSSIGLNFTFDLNPVTFNSRLMCIYQVEFNFSTRHTHTHTHTDGMLEVEHIEVIGSFEEQLLTNNK